MVRGHVKLGLKSVEKFDGRLLLSARQTLQVIVPQQNNCHGVLVVVADGLWFGIERPKFPDAPHRVDGIVPGDIGGCRVRGASCAELPDTRQWWKYPEQETAQNRGNRR